VTDENLGILIADYLKIPFIILSKITIPDTIFRIVPERLARKYKVIAFARDDEGVKLAMVNPKDQEIIDLVVARLEAMPPNISISIGNEGNFEIRDLINRVKINDDVGKKMIEMQLSYLRSLKQLSQNKNDTINH
ncbi:MAG: hypothetical protein AAB975_01715, partial [Patescibacteria group bacterium]